MADARALGLREEYQNGVYTCCPYGQKTDRAENTRDRQVGLEGAMPRYEVVSSDVTWCYGPVRATSSSPTIVLRFHTDRIL
jgi:hypothetical protein